MQISKRRAFQEQRNNPCKVLKRGVCQVCLRNIRQTSVAGMYGVREGVVGGEGREEQRREQIT